MFSSSFAYPVRMSSSPEKRISGPISSAYFSIARILDLIDSFAQARAYEYGATVFCRF